VQSAAKTEIKSSSRKFETRVCEVYKPYRKCITPMCYKAFTTITITKATVTI